jgi:hypothetical protein
VSTGNRRRSKAVAALRRRRSFKQWRRVCSLPRGSSWRGRFLLRLRPKRRTGDDQAAAMASARLWQRGASREGGARYGKGRRGGVLRTRSAGDRAVLGSDAERQRAAGRMPPYSGESGSGTRRTAAPDGPARRARGWAWSGRGPETRAGPSWAKGKRGGLSKRKEEP